MDCANDGTLSLTQCVELSDHRTGAHFAANGDEYTQIRGSGR